MQHGPAASSGSNPKAPGSAGGYLLIVLSVVRQEHSRVSQPSGPRDATADDGIRVFPYSAASQYST